MLGHKVIEPLSAAGIDYSSSSAQTLPPTHFGEKFPAVHERFHEFVLEENFGNSRRASPSSAGTMSRFPSSPAPPLLLATLFVSRNDATSEELPINAETET